MAKPIRATPTLVGDEAIAFVDAMRKRGRKVRLTDTDKNFIKANNVLKFLRF